MAHPPRTPRKSPLPPSPWALCSLTSPTPHLRVPIITATSICENLCTSNQTSTIPAVDTSSGKDHHWWRCHSYYFLEYHVTITYRQYRWPSPVWDVKKSVPATLIPIWLRLSPFKQIRQPERYVSSHYVQQRHHKTTHIYKTQTHEKKVHLSKYDCSELSGNTKQCNTQAQSTCTQEKSV